VPDADGRFGPRRLLASDLTLITVERQGQFVSATYRVGGA